MLGHFRHRLICWWQCKAFCAYQCLHVLSVSDCHLLYNHLHIIKKIFLCNVYHWFLWWYRSLRCEERATTLHRLLWTLWWWAMWPIGLLPFSSPDSKAQVSFSVVVVVNFSHCHLLLQSHWGQFQPNLAQRGSTLFKWRISAFSKGRNYEIAKIHWRNLKIVFCRTTGLIQYISSKHPWVHSKWRTTPSSKGKIITK